YCFFFSSRRRHTRFSRDWSSDVCSSDLDRPVAAADPVISSTSRFCTVSCIQVPAFDTRLATDHQRMLRWRRDRHGEWDPFPAGGGAASRAGAGRAGVEEEDTGRYSGTRRRTPGEGGREAEHRLRRAAAPGTGTRRGPSWQTRSPSQVRWAVPWGPASAKSAGAYGRWGVSGVAHKGAGGGSRGPGHAGGARLPD